MKCTDLTCLIWWILTYVYTCVTNTPGDTERFCHPGSVLMPLLRSDRVLHGLVLMALELHINGNMQYVVFCIWLSLSIMFLRLIPIVPLPTAWKEFVYEYVQFVYPESPDDGCLSYLELWWRKLLWTFLYKFLWCIFSLLFLFDAQIVTSLTSGSPFKPVPVSFWYLLGQS